MYLLLALVPIVLILVLMVGLRWGAARAGAMGYLSAILIAIFFFGAGPELLAYTHARALLLTLDVLLIVWAAYLHFRVVDEAGAIKTLGQALPHLTSDRSMQAVLIGWVFASFLQSVGGFGVPVAVTAPILVGLGFSPLQAVLIPSIGHGWAVTYGSLGAAFQSLLAATSLPAAQLSPFAAPFLGIAGLASGWMVTYAAGRWPAVRRLFLPVLLIGATMSVGQYLIARLGVWNIAAFGGSLAGLLVAFPMAGRITNQDSEPAAQRFPPDRKALALALVNYGVLVAIILAVQFIPALNAFLGKIVLSVQFPEVRTALGMVTPAGPGRTITLFRHTGSLLAYAAGLAFLIYRQTGYFQPGSAGRILRQLFQNMLSPSISIASMITMAVVMENSGMTEQLALGLAQGVGALFPVLAPWIGVMGAFMTGSNTNSNLVFAALQLRTARLLELHPAAILAAQTAGGAIGSIIAPAKVIVGTSTTGMAGQEGLVLRQLVVYAFLLILLISLLTFLSVWIFS